MTFIVIFNYIRRSNCSFVWFFMIINIDNEIRKIENILLKYAFKQARRFFLASDLDSNAEDLVQSTYEKFFRRFQGKDSEIEELIINNVFDRYLKVSIRHKAYDERDKQNHEPIYMTEEPREDEDGEFEDQVVNIQDNTPHQDKSLYFKQMLKILVSVLSEEEEDMCLLKGKGLTFDEISVKLNINSNSLRTKMTAIRLKGNKKVDIDW